MSLSLIVALLLANVFALTASAVLFVSARRTLREARGSAAYVRSARHDVKTMHDRLTADPVLLPFARPQLRIADTGDIA